MQGKGQNLIVRKQVTRTATAGKIILPESSVSDLFFEAVVLHGGLDGEDYKLNPGDRVLVRTSTNNIKIGKTKEGDVYAVEYDFILCSLEPDDDATVYA